MKKFAVGNLIPNSISRWSLFLICLGAVVLRLLTLPHLSFYSDEVWTVRFSSYPVSYIVSHLETGLSMHLYILFTKLLLPFVGDLPISLKAPSLVAGVLLVPALYLITKRLFNPQVALLASLLAACNPFLIVFSRYARVYMILTLLIVLIVALYYRTLQQKQRKYYVWLGLANGVALTLSATVAYLLLIQGCSVVLETLLVPQQRDWRRFWAFGGSFSLSLLIGALFYSPILIQIPTMLGAWTDGSQAWQLDTYLDAFQILHPYASPAMAALLLGGCWLALKEHGQAGRLFVLWAIVPIIFFFVMGSRHTDLAIARFLILALPAHFLLIGLGLLAICRRFVPARPALAAAALTILIIGGTFIYSPTTSLQPISTEPHGSAVAAARLKQIVQADDLLSIDPDHLQWVLRNHFDALYIPLNDLVSGQTDTPYTYPGEGQLIMVAFNDTAAMPIWSQHFATEVIGGPHYLHELVILTSPVLKDEADLRQALLVYFSGSLAGIDREPAYLDLPGRLYRRTAWSHHSLAVLKEPEHLDQEVAEHWAQASKYWELSEQ